MKPNQYQITILSNSARVMRHRGDVCFCSTKDSLPSTRLIESQLWVIVSHNPLTKWLQHGSYHRVLIFTEASAHSNYLISSKVLLCVHMMSVFTCRRSWNRLCMIGASSSPSQTTELRQVIVACVVQLLHWGWVSERILVPIWYLRFSVDPKTRLFLWTWKLTLDVGDGSLAKT